MFLCTVLTILFHLFVFNYSVSIAYMVFIAWLVNQCKQNKQVYIFFIIDMLMQI